MSKTIVGFIGLGVMGEPMCRNLLRKSGHRVRVFDLDPAPVQRLANEGAEPTDSVRALVRECSVVLVSLPSGEVLAKLARSADGLLEHMRSGQIFVDLGTSSVALTKTLAAEFDARGVGYLDAPVARTKQAAEAGTLSVMVGGNPESFAVVEPLLACFATDITHCGAIGSGQITKILNNMVLFETVAALSEAHAIANLAGFDPIVIFNAMSKGSGDSFALRHHGVKAILPQEFPLRTFSVEYAKKDLAYALELAAQHDVNAVGAQRVNSLFDEAIKKGLSQNYFPVVSQLVGRKV